MDVTFDRDAIISALAELVDELVRSGTQIQIRVVGGAAISVAFDRETTTTDVDALYGANPDVENAARTVAYRNGWPENWLNDNVKQFASHFDTADDWINLDIRNGVAIRVAGARLLLAMKLFAARGRRDSQDIDRLLDACAIKDIDGAIAVFERYYPEEELSERALRQLNERFGGSETV